MCSDCFHDCSEKQMISKRLHHINDTEGKGGIWGWQRLYILWPLSLILLSVCPPHGATVGPTPPCCIPPIWGPVQKQQLCLQHVDRALITRSLQCMKELFSIVPDRKHYHATLNPSFTVILFFFSRVPHGPVVGLGITIKSQPTFTDEWMNL